MSVEVPCPQCGAVLKAPPGMGGMKARCKKCQHSFRLPGEPAMPALASEESTQLSVVDQPAFSFEGPAGEVPDAPSPSRGKYKSSIAGAKAPAKGGRANPKSSSGRVVIFTLIALALAGGAAAIVFMNQDKPPATASASKPAEKEKDKEKEPPKKSEKDAAPKTKDDGKANRKTTDKEPTPAAGAVKAETPKAKKGVAVSGGMKLPAPPAKADKVTKPAYKFAIEAPYEQVKAFLITGGDSPVAVVVRATDAGFQGQGAKDTVDRYNLDSGSRIDSTEVDAVHGTGPRILDISPNGENCISEGPAGTLTLYDLGKKAKSDTVKPFKPFATDDAKAVVPPLAAVYFADDKSIIVIAKSGALENWNIREGKKSTAAGIGTPGNYVQGQSFGMKPDRSALAVVVGDNVQIIDTRTLSTKPGLTLPKGVDQSYAIGFADSGDRLAVAYRAATPGPHTLLAVGRIGDPKVKTVHLDTSAGMPERVEWCGPECFVTTFDKAATSLAFETEIHKPLATLSPVGGVGRHATYHGKHFVLLPDATDKMKCLLLGVDFPPDDFLPLRNEAEEAKAAIPFLLTPDGTGR